jgi:uncharacterized protein (TIGR02444 family)
MKFPDHPFWDFALGVYRSEGVPPACLNLQERHGIDVNLMLFCLWLGHSGRGRLDGAEMAQVIAASDLWHRKVVKSLRFVRRALKDGFTEAPEELRQQLRAQVQATEIDAEHLEQLILAAAVPREPLSADAPLAERGADAVASFGIYLNTLSATIEPRDAVDLAHILGKAFKGLAPDAALDLAEVLMTRGT